MSILIGDNLEYKGKSPNFTRDQFETIQEMRDYPADNIDEGHISYVLEDGKHYVYKTGKWSLLEDNVGGVEIAQTTGQSTTAVMSQKAVTDMITEYNVSKLHPTGGIGGTNKYTLETAIAKIPSSLRNVGIKCSFLDEAGTVEEWVYQVGTFTNTDSWMQVGSGSGGNMILEWNTDVATTRNQVPLKKRKEGLQISYKNSDEDWVNEQYIGNILSAQSNTFGFEKNWKKIITDSELAPIKNSVLGYETSKKAENIKVNLLHGRISRITAKNNTSNNIITYFGYTNESGNAIAFINEWGDGSVTNAESATLSAGDSRSVDISLPEQYVGIRLYAQNYTIQDGDISVTVELLPDSEAKIRKNETNISKNAEDITLLDGRLKELSTKVENAISVDSVGDKESIVVDGNFSAGNSNIEIPTANIVDVNNSYLKVNQITKMSSTNYSSNRFMQGYFITTTDLAKAIRENSTKYTRFEFYAYSKEKIFKSNGFRFYGDKSGINAATASMSDTSNEFVKKYIAIIDNSRLTIDSTYIYFSIESNAASQYTAKEDFGITGFKMAIYDTLEEAQNGSIIGDWFGSKDTATIKDIQEQIRLKEYGDYGKEYNNVKRNQDKIGIAIRLIKTESKPKLLNQYERVVVSFNGDSIIGAQLDDITHSSGYDTGDFPPNMSKNILARMFWEKYRFADEDVIFRNLIHSDWTRTGFDVSNGKDDKSQTFNEIEVYGCSDGDSAEITISGQTYVKFVWSEYKGKPYSFDIMQKVDNRVETKLATVEVTAERRLMTAYLIKRLTNTSTYKFRIVPTSGFSDVCFWGIEAWNNPRLDVIVEAFSGSIARHNRNCLLDGYYSDFHRPALLISDMSILNDTSFINNSDYAVDQWMNDNAALYYHLKENGVPALFFIPHCPFRSFLIESAEELAKMHELAYINIPLKQKQNAPTHNIVNGTDGLHLSNYGQTYYFEELERVIDNYVL